MSGRDKWLLLFQNVQNFSGMHAAACWEGTEGKKLTAHPYLVSRL
jgi:hypothetical protein